MPTRAQVETVLVNRRGASLKACDLTTSPATDPSPRAYAGDPIAEALRSLALPVADPTNPTDAELAAVAGDDLPQLLDVAELRLMESCLGNFTQVTWSAGPSKQALTDFRVDLIKQAADKRQDVLRKYGYGLGPPAAAALDLGFAATDDA